MIVCISLDGYSSSLRRVSMSDLVTKWIDDSCDIIGREKIIHLSTRSTILSRKKQRIIKWVVDNCTPQSILLCVGKSFGAVNLLRDILPLREVWSTLMLYDAVGLITVDPNFPKWNDWTPNLNDYRFKLPPAVDACVNVFVESKNPRKQCGAVVSCAKNIPLRGYDHYSVIHAPIIQAEFSMMIGDLKEIRERVNRVKNPLFYGKNNFLV